MDRRSWFFLVAALVCAVLIPATEPRFRWVPIALTITYVVLSLASWADARSRSRLGDEGSRRERRTDVVAHD